MLIVHFGILAVTVLVILYTDHLGFQYVRGVKQTLDRRLTTTLHYTVGAGLLGMIATGLLMSYQGLPFLLTQPVFILKMAFVLILVVNAFFIGRLIPLATETPYAALTKEQKTPLQISGALSTISWIGAIVCAFVFFGWPF